MAASEYFDQVQTMFVTYFGRPPSYAGREYYAGLLDENGGDLGVIVDDFYNAEESAAFFGGQSVKDQVDQVFQNAFGRDANAEGRAYWADQINDGAIALSELAVTVAYNADEADTAVMNAKIDTADQWVDYLNISTEEGEPSPEVSKPRAREFLDAVDTDDPASLDAVARGVTEALDGTASSTPEILMVDAALDQFEQGTTLESFLIDPASETVDLGTLSVAEAARDDEVIADLIEEAGNGEQLQPAELFDWKLADSLANLTVAGEHLVSGAESYRLTDVDTNLGTLTDHAFEIAEAAVNTDAYRFRGVDDRSTAPPDPAEIDIALTGENVAAFDGYRDEIDRTLTDAWNQWAKHFSPAIADRELDIAVSFEGNSDTYVDARGGFQAYPTTREDEIGSTIYDPVSTRKLITGADLNGEEPDGFIEFHSPLSEIFNGPENTYAESLMAHEFGHVLGIAEFFGDGETPFSARVDNNQFNGELSGAVPLQNPAHVTEGLMQPRITPGVEVTDFELRILADIGIPLQGAEFDIA